MPEIASQADAAPGIEPHHLEVVLLRVARASAADEQLGGALLGGDVVAVGDDRGLEVGERALGLHGGHVALGQLAQQLARPACPPAGERRHA